MEKTQSLCYTENGGGNGMSVLRHTFLNTGHHKSAANGQIDSGNETC
jgi:hypothetical protein